MLPSSHRAALIFCLLLGAACAILAQSDGPDLSVATDRGDHRDPRAPEALTQLAFMIGDWQITSEYVLEDGSTMESTARMTGRHTLGGFAVQTEAVHSALANPDLDIFVASHTFTVHPKSGKIVGIAINTLGNRKFNDGEFVGEDFVVIASGEMFGGGDYINRSRYYNITPNRFETRLETSEDGGETWRDGGYSSVFVRSEPPANASHSDRATD